MRSSFFEFNVAISGTFTARANLETISHNTANAATAGFSRQISKNRATEPLAVNTGAGMVGTGSEAYAIERIRDEFLDMKYWTQKCVMGEYSGKMTQLTMLENIFAEMSGDSGLSALFNDFFNKASDLSTTANDQTYRINIVHAADALAQSINFNGEALLKLQTDANTEFAVIINQINSFGEQIVSLNKQITIAELDGSGANDLRDERNRLVDELSGLVNLDATERHDKTYVVMINGYDFINHNRINPLQLVERKPADRRNPMDADGLYDARFTTNNVDFDIYHPGLKGQLKGVVDIRDGNGDAGNPATPTTRYKGIPYYMNKLNGMVRIFALAIDQGLYADNTPIPGVKGHANGYDLNGDHLGTLLFSYDNGPTNGALPPTFYTDDINCLNFGVNQTLKKEPALLNCSDDPTTGESAYNITKGMMLVNTDSSIFREGKLNDYITAINSEMGIDARQASDFEASYGDATTMIDNQRINVSGVDLNEEMVKMIKYQQLYQASAKL
ncbi:MAG: flagellar hook-associated protein FlgK, partial [Clostridiales bacterium]|nr:flagellar hook-associated protein FlgK [Clostridiales bacterium]